MLAGVSGARTVGATASPWPCAAGHQTARRPSAGLLVNDAWTWPLVCRCATGSSSPICLQELYQPANAHFRHYLTADQFASSFGPSEEDYQAVVDFAKAHGLMVKGTHPNRTLLDVSGSVADIEKAFHIKMRLYQHPSRGAHFFRAGC